MSFKSPIEDYRFIYYWTMTLDLYQITNATTIPAIRKSDLERIPLPLPPLAEQERIVKAIERLFSELDKAREIIENILDTFQNRKSAILHQAFSGELTKKWREERGLSLDTWKETTLKDVCEINPKRIDTRFLDDTINVSFIPMTSVSDTLGKITDSRIEQLEKVKKGYTNFIEGDVLFAKITPCMENGKIAVVEKLHNKIGFGSTEFHVLRCSSDLYNKYIYYFIRNQKFRNEAKMVMSGSVGHQRVPKTFLEEYIINFPPLTEQEEIVRILDDTLQKEDKAKELTDTLEQIDLMKKTILAKAFRGELNTNNPDEESALGLLKEILAMPTPKKERVQIKKIVINTDIKKQLSTKLEEDIYKYLAENNNQCDIKDLLSLHKDSLLILQSIDILAHKTIITKKDNLITIKDL